MLARDAGSRAERQGTQDRKRETRADDLRRRMRADILVGRAATRRARCQFPDMCWRYGTSVGVLREALTWLGTQGLVKTQAHQGHVVTPLSRSDLDELTAARAAHRAGRAGAGRRGGKRRVGGPGRRRPPRAHAHPARRGRTTRAGRVEEWAQGARGVPRGALLGLQQPRLLGITEGFGHGAALYRIWSIPYEEDRDVAAEHRGLVEAAVSRDAELAAQRLHDHIAETAEVLREHVDED